MLKSVELGFRSNKGMLSDKVCFERGFEPSGVLPGSQGPDVKVQSHPWSLHLDSQEATARGHCMCRLYNISRHQTIKGNIKNV